MSKVFSTLTIMLAGFALLASPAEDSRNLKKAIDKVDLGGEFLSAQTTPSSFNDFLKKLPSATNGKQELLPQVILKNIYRIFGSHLVKSAAASSKEVAPGCWVYKSYLYLGKENMQLPSIFTAVPAKNKELDFAQLPGDTLIAFSIEADGCAFYDVIKKELQTSPDIAPFVANIETVAEQSGINLRNCMKSMNGKFKFFAAGSSPADMRISLELPDKNGVVANILRQKLNLPPNASQTQLPVFIPVKLNMSSGKIVLQTATPAPANPGRLGDDPAFRNYISRTGTAGNGYFLMNARPQMVQLAKMMMPEQIKAVVDLKPFSMLAIIQRQNEGIYTVSAADFSLTSAFGKGTVSFLCGMLLPALNQARDRARTAACISNLKQISLGLMMYANDNKEHFPAPNGYRGLQLLIDNEYLTDMSTYSCPSSTVSYQGKKLTSECPYIYVGGALGAINKLKNPSRIPVVFERPGNHKKYAVVAFADGHVETVQIPGGNYTDPAQVIGLLSKSADISPEVLNKLLLAVAEN